MRRHLGRKRRKHLQRIAFAQNTDAREKRRPVGRKIEECERQRLNESTGREIDDHTAEVFRMPELEDLPIGKNAGEGG